jgi:hypothetical protein
LGAQLVRTKEKSEADDWISLFKKNKTKTKEEEENKKKQKTKKKQKERGILAGS